MPAKKKFLLSASILSANFASLAEQIRESETAGVDWLHIDVMDGHFVPNISMGPFIVETCRKISRLPLDVHLMIEAPERHIESFAKAGADWISIHIENNNNVHRTLQAIRSLGCKPGIVLNPGTPAAHIASVMDMVDLILVMTVNPGFSGQKFISKMVSKIAEVKEMIKTSNPQALLQVDGGITADNLPGVYRAGAQVIVSASSIYQYPQGITSGIKALRSAV